MVELPLLATRTPALSSSVWEGKAYGLSLFPYQFGIHEGPEKLA